MKPVAICVGHSRHGDNGAVSVTGVSEHAYNCELARMTSSILTSRGIPTVVIDDYEGLGYGAAMRWLAGRLRALDVAFAAELHFNAAGPTATGHEFLHWHSSKHGKQLAAAFSEAMHALVPEIPSRGLKPIDRSARGSEFLRLTHCPAIICEPGFGSNPRDWKVLTARKQAIAEAYARALSTPL